MIVIQEENP